MPESLVSLFMQTVAETRLPRGARATYRCRCGCDFTARVADRKRGWARFCSKKCKAREQEQRTHQYARLTSRQESVDYEGGGWDAHKDIF